MKRRVFGIETEYAFSETPASNRDALLIKILLGMLPYAITLEDVIEEQRASITHADVTRGMKRNPYDRYSGRLESHQMLVNQARAYHDAPHAEYATQECDDVLDLIACEKAGEKHFGRALVALRTILAKVSTGTSVRLFKNNRAYAAPTVDDTGEHPAGFLVSEHAKYDKKFASYGTHENYLVDEGATNERLSYFFLSHLIALSVFAGGGCVEFSGRKNRFEFSRSQRFPWMFLRTGTATKGARCFLVFRGEEFAPSRFRRMQVIANDATLCESSLLLKFAASATMLEMIEDAVFYEEVLKPCIAEKFRWTETDQAVREVALAATTSALDDLLPIPGQYRWTLRGLATFFAEMRQRYAEKEGLGEDRLLGLALEQELLRTLSKHHDIDESVVLAPYADHAFMKQVIERDMTHYGYTYASPPEEVREFSTPGGKSAAMNISQRLRYLEAVCHEIDPGKSRIERAEQKGFIHRVVPPERIEEMMTDAPSTTRAKRRKIIADQLSATGRLAKCNWINVTACNPRVTWDFEDPFVSEPTKEDLEKLALTMHRKK